MTDIKERPILFSAPMVRAILEGRKTVTRRALNDRALKNIGYGVQLGECHELPSEGPLHPNSIGYYNDFCPFGQPGDRLWVRETFNRTNPGGADGVYYYRADGLFPKSIGGGKFTDAESWKPCIHMPRVACRILLEITDVRVERVWDIDDEQSLAEGIYSNPDVNDMYTADGDHHTSKRGGARSAFIHLWESTGGDWNGNPWVWAISFKQVTP